MSWQYRDSHHIAKTVWWPSHLHNGNLKTLSHLVWRQHQISSCNTPVESCAALTKSATTQHNRQRQRYTCITKTPHTSPLEVVYGVPILSAYGQLDTYEQTSVILESICTTFHSWKCVWICCLRNWWRIPISDFSKQFSLLTVKALHRWYFCTLNEHTSPPCSLFMWLLCHQAPISSIAGPRANISELLYQDNKFLLNVPFQAHCRCFLLRGFAKTSLDEINLVIIKSNINLIYTNQSIPFFFIIQILSLLAGHIKC